MIVEIIVLVVVKSCVPYFVIDFKCDVPNILFLEIELKKYKFGTSGLSISGMH